MNESHPESCRGGGLSPSSSPMPCFACNAGCLACRLLALCLGLHRTTCCTWNTDGLPHAAGLIPASTRQTCSRARRALVWHGIIRALNSRGTEPATARSGLGQPPRAGLRTAGEIHVKLNLLPARRSRCLPWRRRSAVSRETAAQSGPWWMERAEQGVFDVRPRMDASHFGSPERRASS